MKHLVCFVVLLLGCPVVADRKSVTDYAPETNVQCPDTDLSPLLRIFTPQTQSLHPREAQYINRRESTILPGAWEDWLGDGSAIGYNFSALARHLPRIGIAFSGGGFRAAQYSAGVVSGLDARNASATAAGTGGLLQVSSYMAGLSGAAYVVPVSCIRLIHVVELGGSWFTGSLLMNDWPTIPDLVYGNGGDLTGWLLDLDLVTPDGIDIFSDQNQAFYGSILWSVVAKANKGMSVRYFYHIYFES